MNDKIKDTNKAIRIKALSEKNLNKLSVLYRSVPSGKCLGCTACCSESVNVSYLEFANIVENGLSKLSEAQMQALTKRVLSYYLLEWVKPQKCPFLDEDRKCMIYDVRPLPCRVFGTPMREAYASNYMGIQRQNIMVAKQIESVYGYKVPKQIIFRKIDFCESFIPDKTLNKKAVDELSSRLINMDGALYFEGLIDETAMNGDLVSWTLNWLVEGIETPSVITKDWLFNLKTDCLKAIQK